MKRLDFIILTGALLSPIKVLPSFKKKTLLEDWNDLTEEQKEVRDYAYKYGRRFGFEKTLVAIAWQESSFGLPRQLSNSKEHSYGVFGGYITTVARRHYDLGEKTYIDKDGKTRINYILPTRSQRDYVKKRLKMDMVFAANHAVLQLEESVYHLRVGLSNKEIKGFSKELYQLIFNNEWFYYWAYYNGGTNCMKEPLALRYARDIKKKINVINKVGYNGS